jgi:hypothetical protein
MNIPAIATTAVAKGFRIASSAMPLVTFVLGTASGLNPVLDTMGAAAVKKTVPVLPYRDISNASEAQIGNVRTDMLLVQVWKDGTPIPTVNDYVILNGLTRKIANIETTVSDATGAPCAAWIIELEDQSGLVTS